MQPRAVDVPLRPGWQCDGRAAFARDQLHDPVRSTQSGRNGRAPFRPADRAQSGGNGWRRPRCLHRDEDTRLTRRNSKDSRASRDRRSDIGGRLPSSCSGARVWMLPKSVEAARAGRGSSAEKRKLEQYFQPEVGLLKKLSALRSPWTQPASWSASTALSDWSAKERQSSGSSGPDWMVWPSVWPPSNCKKSCSTAPCCGIGPSPQRGAAPSRRGRFAGMLWSGDGVSAGLKLCQAARPPRLRRSSIHRARERRGLRRRNRRRPAADNVHR